MKVSDEDRQWALDDMVLDVFCKKASRLNNEGPESQVEFLKSEGMTDEEIESQILERIG